VAPEERGSGLAQELMRRTASFAKGKRGMWLFAETSLREPYARARAFYAKAGFEASVEFNDFYAPGDGKVIYRLKL
jgi:GNAT superfamily N-acetyltransferase